MKHLIDTRNLDEEKIKKILRDTDKFKNENPRKEPLKGKEAIMVFYKSSTRTRISFEVAIRQLGGNVTFLSRQDSQLGRGETVEDTIKVLSRYNDLAIFRIHKHEDLIKMKKASNIPIINALSDLLHPCQALADIYTIKENKKDLNGLNLVFLGDGSSNVCHSLINVSEKTGINMTASCPEEHEPSIKGSFDIERDPEKAVKNADVLYTDTWVSMGEDKKNIKSFKPYQINQNLLKNSNEDSIVMHCLPAHRNQEITDEVMDGEQSVVFDQAENRLHVQKAILNHIIGE